MKYNQLKTRSPKSTKRVGRGIAGGQGKTAGRGTKGQGARAGSSAKPGFAGGSNPLMQKLPKLPGFRSHRKQAETVYTGQLERFAGKTVDAETLAKSGLVSNPFVSIKLIVKGVLTKKVTVKLPSASASAIAAVQSAGGSFEKVETQKRPAKKPAKDAWERLQRYNRLPYVELKDDAKYAGAILIFYTKHVPETVLIPPGSHLWNREAQEPAHEWQIYKRREGFAGSVALSDIASSLPGEIANWALDTQRSVIAQGRFSGEAKDHLESELNAAEGIAVNYDGPSHSYWAKRAR
jgi:large subunit ribosomal protein L15